MGDLLDNMLDATLDVLRGKQTAVTQEMRRLTDDVEALYSAIKLYLAQMPREDLGEQDSRRWAEIIELAINLKLAADLIERMLRKIQQQKTSQRRSFSEEGLEDLAGLQQQLISNLRLGLVGVPQWRPRKRPAVGARETPLSRTGTPIGPCACQPFATQDRAEYRDQFVAPGVDCRHETLEFTVLRQCVCGAGNGGHRSAGGG
jgi:hypothetical protein